MADSCKNSVNPNPLLSAGWMNKVFFWWLKDLIRYGKTEDLVAEDLYDTVPQDLSESLRNCLEIAWENEKDTALAKKRKPSLWKAVTRTYFWDFMKFSIFLASSCVILTISPWLLEIMMTYFNPTSKKTQTRAYLDATVFVGLMVLRTVLSRHGFFHLTRLGMRAKIACSSMIYRKMIKLSAKSSHNHSSVINLLTADVAKFETFFTFAPYVFIVPVQLLATTYLIFQLVKLEATIASVATMIVLTFPVLALYNKIFLKFRTKQAVRTDKRISLIGEVVDGIRAVKTYVWEKYFEYSVRKARRYEIKSYLNISYITSVVWVISSICNRLCVFVVILVYMPQYDTITTEKILPVAQHFYNLQEGITSLLYLGLRRIADMRVSMKRIEKFMLLQEVETNVEKITEGTEDSVILMKNVTVSWNDASHALTNVNLNFASKKLHAVVGAVGSGKSSLLKLILGEVELVSGKLSVHGKVSYASQEPWLFPGSIKSNILFGEPFDNERYEKVISACELLEDFTYLPHADLTLVGDRGMNLSGGQCARVNLARAVYREADIYLFDNPLSSVDTQVAQKLMDQCINNLLKSKTRILVTHNTELLKGDAHVIFLNSGKVEFQGSSDDFRKNNHYLEHLSSVGIETPENTTQKPKVSSDKFNIVVNSSDTKKEPKETEELIAKGNVELSVYTKYIKAGGVYRLFLLILLNCIFVISVTSFDYGLVIWIQEKNSSSKEVISNTTINNRNFMDFNSSNENASLLLGICMLVILLASTLINIKSNIFMLRASNNIHNDMFSRLLRTTLRFFDTNPSGRILNRFSEDTRVADDYLPKVLFEAIQPAFVVIALLLSAVVVQWWIIIPSVILIFLFVLLGKMYVSTIQKLTRLVGNAKSPILSFATSSLAGLTTIRACKAQEIVSKDFDDRQDHHTAAQFLVWALIPANYLWVELINLGLLASTVYVCIVLKSDDTSEGHVGLALMQIMNMITLLSTMLIRLVQALSYMPNIERMLQFTELQHEDFISSKLESEMSSSWPCKAEIKFEKLYLRYADDSDPVLWNLNFTIAPGSKVGIVGRTGAGKSSLITALFRLARIDGSLFIDGVDTQTIELSKLRSKISIIPQEPFLFQGTLRKNLDPFAEFDDALLWSVLEDVKMKETFDTLDSAIDSGGSNLSLGQRQLLCLARAILRKNKILILDEATANIDLATDALIQKTIRQKFKDCTVLTIAHRLNTVMDSDKILVMDNGRVVEYDHPFLLLKNNESHFSKIIEQTDNATAQQLKVIAEQAYENL